MPRLVPVGEDRLLKFMCKHGFSSPFLVNRYRFIVKGELRLRWPSPDAKEGNISAELLSRILKQAGINF